MLHLSGTSPLLYSITERELGLTLDNSGHTQVLGVIENLLVTCERGDSLEVASQSQYHLLNSYALRHPHLMYVLMTPQILFLNGRNGRCSYHVSNLFPA